MPALRSSLVLGKQCGPHEVANNYHEAQGEG
jgi:hypothetical protein